MTGGGFAEQITAAQKAVRKAKRERNAAIEQGRTSALLRGLQSAGIRIENFARQVKFYGLHKTAHPWKFDLADAQYLVAIEIDGGGYAGKPCPLCGQRPGGRHSRGDRDSERAKLNEAQAMGWRVLSFSGTAIDRRLDECVTVILAVYGGN